jgi:hypothetical protein
MDGYPGPVHTLDSLITTWSTFPDAADALDVEVSKIRRMVDDGLLVAVRRGDPEVRSIPTELIQDGHVVPYLQGTITVLRDGGFSDEELLAWLFRSDDSLPGRPIDELRAGRRGEVRRRAQAMAF